VRRQEGVWPLPCLAAASSHRARRGEARGSRSEGDNNRRGRCQAAPAWHIEGPHAWAACKASRVWARRAHPAWRHTPGIYGPSAGGPRSPQQRQQDVDQQVLGRGQGGKRSGIRPFKLGVGHADKASLTRAAASSCASLPCPAAAGRRRSHIRQPAMPKRLLRVHITLSQTSFSMNTPSGCAARGTARAAKTGFRRNLAHFSFAPRACAPTSR
jgi:hypothetical protein